jgi:hypothetical protein
MDLCAKLVALDGTEVGPVTGLSVIDDSQLTVTYSPKPGKDFPNKIYVGIDRADTPYAFNLSKGNDQLEIRRLPLSGDFCQPDEKSNCASKLFDQNNNPKPNLKGYVYGAGGVGYTQITVNNLQPHSVDVRYTADPSLHPLWVVLEAADVSLTFPYVQALPNLVLNAVYLVDDIENVCKTPKPEPAGTTKLCGTGHLPKSAALMPSDASSIETLSINEHRLFARVHTIGGELPQIIVVTAEDGKSTIGRRITSPGSDQSALEISPTIMDQETMRRNYGASLAQQYIAVKLSISNRTSKKLQFNKSAVYFDVDFIETPYKYKLNTRNKASNLSFDVVEANVYAPPFSTTFCKDYSSSHDKKGIERPCQLFRFDIDQSQRVRADSYMAVLGSFDYNTQRTDRLLHDVELFGSVLTAIATGGVVAQVHNTAFRDATTILTGIFLPGQRGIIMNNAEINRERANLVAQTFQETVQLPPNQLSETVMLLPREAILDVQGYSKGVVIDRILNVHIDPDVVNGAKDAPVPLGKVDTGYTRDQVRQALGEPPTVNTNADGTIVFAYNAGNYKSITFDKDGHVSGAPVERTITDQISSGSLIEVMKSLKDHLYTATPLTLLNGNTILVDITVPGVSDVLQFDKDGKRLGNYTLLYDKIKVYEAAGGSKANLEKLLASLKLPKASETYPPAGKVLGGDKKATYAMPDVVGGTIDVTFATSALKDDAVIAKISFGGMKPASR